MNGYLLIYSATKSLCLFSHVKLCIEIQLWCHFLYQLQCRWLSWAEGLNLSRYNTCSTITRGDMACWSWVPGSANRQLTLETLPHTQGAHVTLSFCCNLQSCSATVFQHAVRFLFWIFISCSSVCSLAFSYVDILQWRDPAYYAILTANHGFPDLRVTCQFYQPWLFIYYHMADANFKSGQAQCQFHTI